ncbi:hypothetical protein KJ039_03295 [bacterium]|nr:hypothetical protein [bacterium]
MEFIKEVNFNLDEDLRKIAATIEGRLVSLAANKPPSDSETVRVYLIEPPALPLAVFDRVPYNLYLDSFLCSDMTLADGSSPELIRLAAFDGDECLGAGWISVPAVIWTSILLAEHLVTDLKFFHQYARDQLALKLSRRGSPEEDPNP